VDGSRVEIPNGEETRRVYGESEDEYGKAVARASFGGLYDIYNRFSRHRGASFQKQQDRECKGITNERFRYFLTETMCHWSS
jgi:hypothetical protein